MKNRSVIWTVLLALVAGIVIAGAVALVVFAAGEVIPPQSLTHAAMHMAKRRILRYAALNDRLPTTLAQTSPIPGYYDSTKDAWGRELIYTTDPNGDVILMSLGKDNAPGGEGDNADMIGQFSPKNADGSWAAELVDWKQDPFRNPRK